MTTHKKASDDSSELDLALKRAELDLKSKQIQTESWRRWVQLVTALAVVTALSGIWWNSQQIKLQRRGAEFEEFRSALGSLSVESEVGRTAAYQSLISYLTSTSERDLQDAAFHALLHTLSLESETNLRAAVVHSLNKPLIEGLPVKSRRRGIDFALVLLRHLSQEIEKAEEDGEVPEGAEQRRRDMVVVIGRLLTGWHAEELNLKNLNLEGLRVSDARLPDADFTHSNLLDSRFERCDLSGARFTFSELKVDFLDSNLTEAKLKADLFKPSSFRGSDLTGAELRNYSFMELNYRHSVPWQGLGSFEGAVLRDTVFTKPSILLFLAPGEMERQRLPPVPTAMVQYRQLKEFKMGLTLGIRPPTLSYVTEDQRILPVLRAPIESLAWIEDKEPMIKEDLRLILAEIHRNLEQAEVRQYRFSNEELASLISAVGSN